MTGDLSHIQPTLGLRAFRLEMQHPPVDQVEPWSLGDRRCCASEDALRKALHIAPLTGPDSNRVTTDNRTEGAF